MGRPLLRSDCADTETVVRAKAAQSCNNLLSALREHHGCVVEQIEIVHEVGPSPPLRDRLPPVQPISLDEAFRRAWQFVEGPKPIIAGKVELIQRAVLTFYPFTMADLKSVRRTAAVVRARQIAMYLVKDMTSRSLPEIGRQFGGRDHTTVLHAHRKISGMVKNDLVFAAHVSAIRTFIEGDSNAE